MAKGVELKERTEDLLTELSLALAELHLSGYREGYNAKALEWAILYKDGNNPALRVEATNRYLEGLKLEKTYAEETDAIIDKIKNLLFEVKED